ncbi:unnamed protein product [Periconia digitata]|uniref:Carrier domain-containing protein n=1 Tax=Periconia digitata TaxID=1303443 RepID=A0A9W4UL01_9PLEO|nr:unnamed protein product [Periconia digitata]
MINGFPSTIQGRNVLFSTSHTKPNLNLSPPELGNILQLSPSSINTSRALIELDMDSLIDVEVWSWIFRETGQNISVLKILSGLCVDDICLEVVAALSVGSQVRDVEGSADAPSTVPDKSPGSALSSSEPDTTTTISTADSTVVSTGREEDANEKHRQSHKLEPISNRQ